MAIMHSGLPSKNNRCKLWITCRQRKLSLELNETVYMFAVHTPETP